MMMEIVAYIDGRMESNEAAGRHSGAATDLQS